MCAAADCAATSLPGKPGSAARQKLIDSGGAARLYFACSKRPRPERAFPSQPVTMLSLILLQAANATTTAAAATTTAAVPVASDLGSPVTAYWPVMIFFAFAVVFPVLPIVLGRLLRPSIYQK